MLFIVVGFWGGQDDVERQRNPIFGTSKEVRLHFDNSYSFSDK